MNEHELGWLNEAACKEVGPTRMYPEPGNRLAEAEAIATCLGCTVMDECLAYALQHRENVGVWGGHTAQERIKIRRKITREHSREARTSNLHQT